jgi:hypothetical protein
MFPTANARQSQNLTHWSVLSGPVVALANLVRQREQESEVGPIAIIAPDDATFEQACQFAHVAELVRPIRVFREWHEGRRWIDAIAIDRAKAAG